MQFGASACDLGKVLMIVQRDGRRSAEAWQSDLDARMHIEKLLDAMERRAKRDSHIRGQFGLVFQKVRGVRPPNQCSPDRKSAYEHLWGFGEDANKYLPRGKPKEELIPITRRQLKFIRASLIEFKMSVDPPEVGDKASMPIFDPWPFLNHALRAIWPFEDESSKLGIAKSFRDRTSEIFTEYIESESGQVPFGGRNAELQRLNSWLDDERAAPRMLITSPTGWGKSALVVRWLMLVEQRKSDTLRWHIAFMPISIRCTTNLPGIFFEGLAQRLSEITRVPIESGALNNLNVFKDETRKQLLHVASSDRRVLVVVDGLDEALHGSFAASVIPLKLPNNLRILLSARQQVGDVDSTGWLHRLGWDRNVRVSTFELAPLSREGIADILIKLGAPVEQLAHRSGFVARLFELTLGEPILVRCYAEDLWGRASTGARITRSDLDTLTPGFSSYLRRLLSIQEDLWRQEGVDLAKGDVDVALSILSYAHGRLEARDFLNLVETIYQGHGVVTERRLLQPLRRFVIGNGRSGQGYVLSHPKIGECLQEEWYDGRRTEIQDGFIKWGLTHLRALNSDGLSPVDASPYALQFLQQHFKDGNAAPSAWMNFVQDGWRRAWEHFEGGPRGFSDDVHAAWQAVRRNDQGTQIAEQWRCVLVLSSIRSVGHTLSAPVLLAAVRCNVLPVSQAVLLAGMLTSDEDAVQTLAHLAVHYTTQTTLAVELLSAAFGRAQDHREEYMVGVKLHLLRKELSSESRVEVILQILPVARAIDEANYRAEMLAFLVTKLPPPQKIEVSNEALAIAIVADECSAVADVLDIMSSDLLEAQLDEALIAIKGFEVKARYCAFALASIAKHLSEGQVRDAFAIICSIEDEEDYAEAVCSLIDYLSPEQLAEVLERTRAMADESNVEVVLTALAPRRLPEEYFDEALTHARAMASPLACAKALISLAKDAPDKCLAGATSDALEAVKKVENGAVRVSLLVSLSSLLSTSLKEKVFVETFNEFRRLKDEGSLGTAPWLELVPHLPTKPRAEALAKAITMIKENCCKGLDADVLAPVARYLSAKQLDDIISVAWGSKDRWLRMEILRSLGNHLSPRQLEEATSRAKALAIEDESATILGLLATYLSGEYRAKVLADALSTAKRISSEDSRAEVLKELFPQLLLDCDHERLLDVLHAAQSIKEKSERAKVLSAFTVALNSDQQRGIITKVISAARVIGDDHRRVHVLSSLSGHLPEKQRRHILAELFDEAKKRGDEAFTRIVIGSLAGQFSTEQIDDALVVVRTIEDEHRRALTLCAIAPFLSEQRQLDEALGLAETIDDERVRAETLAAFVPNLLGEARDGALLKILTVAASLDISFTKVRIICSVAGYLSAEQRDESLAEFRQIADDYSRALALGWLAPHLPEKQRIEVLAESLAVAGGIKQQWYRDSALIEIEPNLIAEQLDALIALAPALSAGGCSRLLTSLVSRLSPDQISGVFAVADGIESDRYRAETLMALAPRLSDDQLLKAIATSERFESDEIRAVAMGALLSFSSSDQDSERFVAELASTDALDGEARVRALRLLIPYAKRDQYANILDRLVTAAARLPREEVLEAIAASTHIAASLGTPGTIENIVCAIHDTVMMYP
jgi:hypothetical protein